MSDATQAKPAKASRDYLAARAAYNLLAALERIAGTEAPTDLAALIAKFVEVRLVARNAADAAYTPILRFGLKDPAD